MSQAPVAWPLRRSGRRFEGLVTRFDGYLEGRSPLRLAGIAAAAIVVDKIHRAVERVAAERGCQLGVSLGVVTFAEPPADVERALTLADDRMFEEKRARKTAR